MYLKYKDKDKDKDKEIFMNTTLDSIILSTNFDNIKINKDNFKKIIAYDDDNNKSIIYSLKDKIKNNIFGLEKLLVKNKATKQGKIKKIELGFNAKLLGTEYLQGLSKKNIKQALKGLTKKLKHSIKLNVKNILNKYRVGYCDFTKNINVSDYSITEYLKAINYHVITNRQLKDIKTTFLNEGTLTFMLSNSERFIIYDKNKELHSMIDDKKQGSFIGAYPQLLKKSLNILRLETRIIGNKRLSKILNIQLKNDDDYITLKQVLNSEVNLSYERLKAYSNKKIKNDVIDINFSNINKLKDFNKYLIGKSLFETYNKDYNKLKKDLINIYKNHNSKNKTYIFKVFYRYLDNINYYLCFNELRENKINYTVLFNEIIDKLKVA